MFNSIFERTSTYSRFRLVTREQPVPFFTFSRDCTIISAFLRFQQTRTIIRFPFYFISFLFLFAIVVRLSKFASCPASIIVSFRNGIDRSLSSQYRVLHAYVVIVCSFFDFLLNNLNVILLSLRAKLT